MKIVIIGGGVAGLAFGAIMQKKGHEVSINERGKNIPLGGNAFMMHEDGQKILRSILGKKNNLPGREVNRFVFNRPNGESLMNTPMESWRCMKRSDLISTLVTAVKKNTIKYDRAFSHFLFDSGIAVAAVFENGEVETGDLFVGADGCHSAVRQLIFGDTHFSTTEVKEILGTVKDKELVSSLNNTFTKFQDKEKGLSFGFIPVSEDEMVWFSQFDAKMEKGPLVSKESIMSFAKELLIDFPEKVKNIVDKTSLQDFYLWNTKDFDPLTSFHSANIVLVGDSAHVSLPFTSAGTTNALIDADVLSNCLENNLFLSEALRQFYEERIESVRQHVNAGRKLKNEFLHPNTKSSNSISIPLIKDAVIKK